MLDSGWVRQYGILRQINDDFGISQHFRSKLACGAVVEFSSGNDMNVTACVFSGFSSRVTRRGIYDQNLLKTPGLEFEFFKASGPEGSCIEGGDNYAG